MIVEIDVMQLEIALPRSKSAKPDVKKLRLRSSKRFDTKNHILVILLSYSAIALLLT